MPRRQNSTKSQIVKKDTTLWIWRLGVVFGSLSVLIIAYLSVFQIDEKGISRPIEFPLVISRDYDEKRMEYFWGSYRPGNYFGLKTRSPSLDLLTGLMWMVPEDIKRDDIGLRHWAEQSDNLETYGWMEHDGKNFGVHEMRDKTVFLNASFIKVFGGSHGGNWRARISVRAKSPIFSNRSIALFFYVGVEGGVTTTNYSLNPVFNTHGLMTGIEGQTEALGRFSLEFTDKGPFHFHSALSSKGPSFYKESILSKLRRHSSFVIGLDSSVEEERDLIVYQVVAPLPFDLDISFKSHSFVGSSGQKISTNVFDSELRRQSESFNDKFNRIFQLRDKGFNEKEISFAKAALSNLLGGIGYFYGHSLVTSSSLKEPIDYWDAPLYTAVPSRSFFPRGFLWDEGFHNLLISKWNPMISIDILGHWLDLMNKDGWIPREQILGEEARARVPKEFIVQRSENANPPTLFLTLSALSNDFRRNEKLRGYLEKMWPRLQAWYDWFTRTQSGVLPGTYRWYGRNASSLHELNPKTLTSGLDDFPRASHPTNEERHVDLRCWMAFASSSMVELGEILNKTKDEISKYIETAKYLMDNEFLDNLHWSERHGAYLDYGLHSEAVILQTPSPPYNYRGPSLQKIRIVKTEPILQFVPQVGYVSLFPFLLRILNVESRKLEKILSDLENPSIFSSNYGLRSLSKDSSLYSKGNTEHDSPYWRGAIWININYLALRSLNYYSKSAGPYSSISARIYQNLRSQLLKTVLNEYYRTGYIWEQYNDSTGRGQGCKPFTGWSSLILLIMGENY